MTGCKWTLAAVFSGDYEIDSHVSAGARRLAERRPGLVGYKMRIGYPSVYNMDRMNRPMTVAR